MAIDERSAPMRAGELRRELRALVRVVRRVAPGRATAQAVAVLLLALTEGVGLVLLVPVVTALDSTGAVDTDNVPVLSALGLDDISLGVALSVLVAVVAARALIGRWSSVNGTTVRLTVVDRLRSDCLDAVLRARWEFVLGRRRSDIVEVVTVGANRVGVSVELSITLLTGVLVATATAAVAIVISPLVGGIALLVSIAAASVLLPAIRSARWLGREFGRRSQSAMATTTDALDALRLVRAHDAIGPWEGAVESGYADLRAAQLRHARATSTANAISSVLLVAGTATFVYFAARTDMATGTLVVLLVVLSRLASRSMGVARMLPTLGASLGALSDVEQLRSSAEAAAEVGADSGSPGEHATIEHDRGPTRPLVEMQSVTYRYPDGTEAVSDLDLHVERGAVTVLVGSSGAGKSTIVDLILGLLTPTSGAVLVDGDELSDDRLASWRSRLGYVPQETGLLPGTVRENLSWSAIGEVDDERCWAALDDAAASFVRTLPDGLDTPLGDRGVRLSGGQRQRVALARALIRRPELLILDEATNALDLDTEAEVLDLVRRLCPETTVVLVTHRVGSIRPTDRVVRVGEPG